VRAGHRGDAPVAPDLVAGFAPQLCLADAAYDSDALRQGLLDRGATPVIPNNPTRKRNHRIIRKANKHTATVPAHSIISRLETKPKYAGQQFSPNCIALYAALSGSLNR
jgi:hypothetical protein